MFLHVLKTVFWFKLFYSTKFITKKNSSQLVMCNPFHKLYYVSIAAVEHDGL